MEIRKISLKEYSSLRIGGEGDLVVITSEEELVEVLKYARTEDLRIHILGEGTNSYFANNLSKFLFITLEMKGVDISESQTVKQSESLTSNGLLYITACAGEKWDDIVSYSVEKELWGIENLSLIPGTVGASPIQNIGAYGVELKDVLESVRVYDTKVESFIELSNNDCKFGYRDSVFKQEIGRYIVTAITLKLSTQTRPVLTYKPLDILVGKESLTLQEVRELVITTRQTKLPNWKECPNAGSFFKNPVVTSTQGEALRTIYPDIPLHETASGYKIPAAWLIEHIAQMKGVQIGNIGTWPNQPLVIVNYGEATHEELFSFSKKIIESIQEKVGVTLEREVSLVG